MQAVQASCFYSDEDGSHFLDQENYETVTLSGQMVGDALDFLIDGALIELRKYNGNPIGLELPIFVELDVVYTGTCGSRRLLGRRDQDCPAGDGLGDPGASSSKWGKR